MSLLSVKICSGKYTVIQEKSGNVRALRYGEEWRDCCGDGLILALAQEIDLLRSGALLLLKQTKEEKQ